MKTKEKNQSQKLAELTALYEISSALTSSLDPGETAKRILGILASSLAMRRGTLTLLDPETGELVIETAHGLTNEEKARGRFKVGEGVTGRVFERGEPMIVPDLGKEPLFLNRTRSRGDLGKEKIAFICMPVKVQGEVFGVLSVDRLFKTGAQDLEDDVRVLTVVASLIGQAVKIQRTLFHEKKELEEQNIQLRSELQARHGFENIIGKSKIMEDIFQAVLQVCKSKASVLLRGESGTGKEMIARAIHYNSPRAKGPFIKVNCAALPDTLLESELFGHERGAFTGATQLRKGRFELATSGTLFLDEIGDFPAPTQVKLLRVLQEQKFERLGGTETLSVDVRLVAATHRDLELAMKEGIFREDLYYRLNVVPIFLPSLRERPEDIPLLIDHFLVRCNKENAKDVRIASDVLRIMMGYHWPGNVRELENCVERLVVMSSRREVRFDNLPPSLSNYFQDIRNVSRSAKSEKPSLQNTVEVMEREQVISALKKSGWVQSRAAKILGITPRQIGYKIKKYRIESLL